MRSVEFRDRDLNETWSWGLTTVHCRLAILKNFSASYPVVISERSFLLTRG